MERGTLPASTKKCTCVTLQGLGGARERLWIQEKCVTADKAYGNVFIWLQGIPLRSEAKAQAGERRKKKKKKKGRDKGIHPFLRAKLVSVLFGRLDSQSHVWFSAP